MNDRASDPSVAIAVVPRERLSTTPATVADITRRAPAADVVWIDNGHSRKARAAIAAQSPQARRVPVDRWARPGAMHNVAIDATDGDYLVFVDNDVTVRDGWLEAMVACAEETGADAVSPVILSTYRRGRTTVHFAGGVILSYAENGRIVIDDSHRYGGAPVDAIETITRQAVDLCELHCVLFRRRSLERIGPLDPGLATRELIEWFLRLRALGGTAWVEPSAVVSYSVPPPFTLRDRAYYLLRWSERWTNASYTHFEEQYGIAFSEHSRNWMRMQRQRAYGPWFYGLGLLIGKQRSERLRKTAFSAVEVPFNRATIAVWRRFDPNIW